MLNLSSCVRARLEFAVLASIFIFVCVDPVPFPLLFFIVHIICQHMTVAVRAMVSDIVFFGFK